MKTTYFLALITLLVVSSAYAETTPTTTPTIVPVSSSAEPVAPTTTTTPPAAATSTNCNVTNCANASDVSKLKKDISYLKRKLKTQTAALNNLKATNAELTKKLTKLSKKAIVAAEVKKSPAIIPELKKLTPVIGDDKTRYQAALAAFKQGGINRATGEFQALLKSSPKSSYADNAQFWIAEGLLRKGDKVAALKAFDQLTQRYPNSEKIPESLYKLGSVLMTIHQKSKAKEYLQYLVAYYPKTSSAKLASQKLKQLK